MDYRPKIKLSQDEFRVLASSTRIDIMKLLDESQLTVSDVSRKLNMNKATVHEHLTKLIEVGLVSKEESPRKWVYYRLTWKGRNLLHPERVKVMVSLAIILMVIVVGSLLVAYQTDLLFYWDDNTDGDEKPTPTETTTRFLWDPLTETSDSYDIRFVSSSGITMASVKEMSSYLERGPTSITRHEPLNLRWTREGDVIHIYDYDDLLVDHEGEYLYVEGMVLDDRGIERPFSLKRYIVPQGMEIDLRISDIGIVIDTENMTSSGLVRITFTVENVGTSSVNATPVEVFSVKRTFMASGLPAYGSPYLNQLFKQAIDLPNNSSKNITFEVPVRELFLRAVMVFVDPGNEMPEAPTDNNDATVMLPDEVVEANLHDISSPGPAAEDAESSSLPAFSMAMVVALVVILVVVGVVVFQHLRR